MVNKKLQDQVSKFKERAKQKNTELESNIKKKGRENSEFLSQIADLKKEVAKKAQELQKMQKEKEDLQVRVKNLIQQNAIKNARKYK